jgi:large subunit ribosomal protein L6
MLPKSALGTALRCFSTTSRASAALVSNIGKKPITLPPSIALAPSPTGVAVTGPLGTTTVPYPEFVKLDLQDEKLLAVSVEDASVKRQRMIWGRTRTLISNAIVGMTEGFQTPVYLVGVGYRVALEADPLGKRPGWTGQRLNMKIGFSHSVYVPVPDHIKLEVVSPTKILLNCTDKQAIGQFAAEIRRWRPPEPYKGKVRSLILIGMWLRDERAFER